MADFFISYTGVDRAWAEWIAWQLQADGYTVVLQAWHFSDGRSFVQAMNQASMDAKCTIAVLSPDYLTAPFPQSEWQAAFARDPVGEQGLLLPIRVRSCKPPGLLAARVYIDLVGLAEDAARERLLTGVRHRGMGRTPTTAPPFPGALMRTVSTRPRFPGLLPPIWNVPHYNLNFTDRDQLLIALHQALTSGQPAARTQALCGLGGVGKTQLAIKYAYLHATDYDLVWWIRAEEPVTLMAGYASLATAMQLPGHDASDQTVESVRRWLEQRTGWLLVFDNAEGSAALRPYLPRGGGHVLITSRNQVWGGVASTLPMRVFARADAVAFLLGATGEVDEATAGTLAELLGDLPLALEQACAYIDATGITLAEYLQLFTTSSQALLRYGTHSSDDHTVATAWGIAMQRVQDEQPAAADLLYLCAFLASDDIPRDLIRGGCEHLPEALAVAVTDLIAFNNMVAALRRYSLLEKEGEAFSVHRLVQAVTRERLGEEACAVWAEIAVRLVESAFLFDEDDESTWSSCVRLLPHALIAIDYGEAWQVAAEETGRLLDRLGGYFQVSAQFSTAHTVHLAELCERALAIAGVTYSTPPTATAPG